MKHNVLRRFGVQVTAPSGALVRVRRIRLMAFTPGNALLQARRHLPGYQSHIGRVRRDY